MALTILNFLLLIVITHRLERSVIIIRAIRFILFLNFFFHSLTTRFLAIFLHKISTPYTFFNFSQIFAHYIIIFKILTISINFDCIILGNVIFLIIKFVFIRFPCNSSRSIIALVFTVTEYLITLI